MTKHEKDKLDMLLHIVTEHRQESQSNHDKLQDIMTTHAEDIATLKERSKSTKNHIKYLYTLVMAALGFTGTTM